MTMELTCVHSCSTRWLSHSVSTRSRNGSSSGLSTEEEEEGEESGVLSNCLEAVMTSPVNGLLALSTITEQEIQ